MRYLHPATIARCRTVTIHLPARPLKFLALALATACCLHGAIPPAPVPRWGRFAATIANSRTYADPFHAVSLDVIYTRPDGSTAAFWGFHDGARGWKIRFMPDWPGTWRYVAKFSDGTSGASGSFECVDSGQPGPITVHAANPVWFGRRGGEALLVRGFHIGDCFFARNWDDPASDADGNPRARFLEWAKAQGYNTLSVASHYLNRASPGRGEGWDTPRLWPLDAAEFQRLELILDDLATRGFFVYPFAGFFGRDSGFPRDPADQTRYVRYVLARLAPYGHLFFNVAGPEPLLRGKPYLPADEVNRLGAEIAWLDPFAHPISVHNQTGDDAFKDSPWLTYGTLQGPKTLSRRELATGLLRNHHPHKPLLAQETLWSGNTFHLRKNKADYSEADLRKNTCAIHFCAAALVFADNDGDSSSGFTGTLDPAIRRQGRHDIIKRTWDLLATLPWQRTTPHPELVATSGDIAPLCLAEPGRTYLVYLESRASVDVRLTGGTFSVEWIDAQNPANRHQAGTTNNGNDLTPPTGGDDWLLVLRRAARE